jgi:hypothetical protein
MVQETAWVCGGRVLEESEHESYVAGGSGTDGNLTYGLMASLMPNNKRAKLCQIISARNYRDSCAVMRLRHAGQQRVEIGEVM